MNYLKKLIAIFLINLSKAIYYAIPKELLDFSDNSISKTLQKELNQETIDLLYTPIKKAIKFNTKEEIRGMAINLAIENESNLEKGYEYFYLEFGVYKGDSANFFAKKVKKIYAFDSFQGLRSDWEGALPKGTFNLNKKIPKLKRNVIPVVGWAEDTIENFLITNSPKINFVHFDMDLYDSTKFTLKVIKPYLTKGAVLLFDEYFNFINWKEGEYKAFTELFNEDEYTYKAFNIKGKQTLIQLN